MRYLKSVSLDIIYLLALMLLETFLAETARALFALFFCAGLAHIVPTFIAEYEVGLVNRLVLFANITCSIFFRAAPLGIGAAQVSVHCICSAVYVFTDFLLAVGAFMLGRLFTYIAFGLRHFYRLVHGTSG